VINTLPKLSIVTPSFNQGEFLEECIVSVLGQNYPNLEYIIMDGGSSDNSVEIIKKYEKYLTYWQSIADGGQYAAIEDGFRRSTGEIMAWLNSDDKYHHNSFFKVAYTFSSFEELEWIVGRPTIWDKNGDVNLVYSYLPTYGRGKFLQKDYNRFFIQQESTFWRRSLWEKSGCYLRRDLDYAGDLDLWLRFFRHAELHTVDAILGGYRSHGNQKSALCMDKYMAEVEMILDAEIDLFKCSEGADCSEPPKILTINADDVAKYIDAACAGLEKKCFRFGDDSDKVTACLLRQLDELEAVHTSLFWRLTKPLRWLCGSTLK
jgi:glycosyltransferase involved in cell wall biosynthesis